MTGLDPATHAPRGRIDELDRADSDLHNLFQSTQIATIFLDRNLVIRSFTPAVTRLFNLIPTDRVRPLTDIVSRIHYPDLEADMRSVFAGGEVVECALRLNGEKAHIWFGFCPIGPPTTRSTAADHAEAAAGTVSALVIHELSTNAAQYGALSVAEGRVEIDWTIAGNNPSRLEFNWKESGGPTIQNLSKRGFGMELIERGIRFEPRGEAKVETFDGAVHCRITVPANPDYWVFGAPPRSRIEEAAS